MFLGEVPTVPDGGRSTAPPEIVPASPGRRGDTLLGQWGLIHQGPSCPDSSPGVPTLENEDTSLLRVRGCGRVGKRERGNPD